MIGTLMLILIAEKLEVVSPFLASLLVGFVAVIGTGKAILDFFDRIKED